MIARHLSGIFPDYERVVPKETGYTLTFDRQAALETITAAGKCADDRSGCIRQHLHGSCIVSTKVEGKPAFSREIAANWDGPEGDIGMHWRYLSDFLKVVGENTITLGFQPDKVTVNDAGEETERKPQWMNSMVDYIGMSSREVIAPMRV